jgi:hypothetical protein
VTLRTVYDPLPTPPAGAVTLGVARHITEVYPDPRMLEYHRERAGLIHDLVAATSIDVIDWGRTDREDPPNEIVELLTQWAPTVIPAAATLIAAWIGRPRKSAAEKPTVLGVSLKRADGTQIQFDYKTSEDLEKVARTIREFLLEPSTPDTATA